MRNLPSMNQTWGTRDIHVFSPFVASSNFDCREVRLTQLTDLYWSPEIKVHHGIIINPKSTNIGTLKISPWRRGDQFHKKNQSIICIPTCIACILSCITFPQKREVSSKTKSNQSSTF